MTEKCEPPPELRDRDGWHWVETYGRKRCAYWWERTAGDWCWWNASNDDGWRYLAPVTPPATVAALVEALEAAVSAGEALETRTGVQIKGPVWANAQAALALYRGEAGR